MKCALPSDWIHQRFSGRDPHRQGRPGAAAAGDPPAAECHQPGSGRHRGAHQHSFPPWHTFLWTGSYSNGSMHVLCVPILDIRNVPECVPAQLQAFNFVTALSPFSPTFDEDNQADVRKRPAGPTQKAIYPNKPAVSSRCVKCLAEQTFGSICILEKCLPQRVAYTPGQLEVSVPTSINNDHAHLCMQEYLGTSKGFGFTKKNELFVGRTAMLVSCNPCHVWSLLPSMQMSCIICLLPG